MNNAPNQPLSVRRALPDGSASAWSARVVLGVGLADEQAELGSSSDSVSGKRCKC